MNQNQKIIDKINLPEDLKPLTTRELGILSEQIREFLINNISNTGGHLGSNLGIVELTVAIHKAFDSPKDKIIWDVGHQSYVHKILTGRKDKFCKLRKYNGLSGFTKRSESEHDIFGAGHSSTSLSAAIGIVTANKISKIDDSYTLAVIGDGSFTGGLVYEALNNAKNSKKFIVILNDNEMSISKNVGSIADYLAEIRTTEKYFILKHRTQKILKAIPFIGKYIVKFLQGIKKLLRRSLYNTTFFEQLGFDFLGPVNGHDIEKLLSVLNEAKLRDRPVFIHVKTQKGKGYEKAENSSVEYHSVGKFDIENGLEIAKPNIINSYSDNFGRKICEAAKINEKICAITAAMTEGTGLNLFKENFPDRFYDVGIAEEHAVLFSSGLAVGGALPVFAVYSSFFQRAYDQILHDASLQNLHVVFCIDRAGLVGEDGATHHGIFDVSFLNHIPNIIIFSPSSYREFDDSFDCALDKNKINGPVVIRYPKGGEDAEFNARLYNNTEYNINFIYKQEYSDTDCDFLIISYGRMSKIAFDVHEKLNSSNKKSNFLKLNKIKPVEIAVWDIIKNAGKNIIVIEESIKNGGIAEYIAVNMAKMNLINSDKKIKIYAIDSFVEHGSVEQLFETCGFNADKIYSEITEKI